MRKLFLFAAAVALLFTSVVPAMAARYENARFEYRVDVPDDFEWLPEAANGDGRVFRHRENPGVTITFFARVQQGDGDTLALEGASRIPPGASRVEGLQSGPSYHVSFVENGMYTEVLIFLAYGAFHSATVRWPESEDEKYKLLTGSVLQSWKIRGNPTVY